MRVVFVGAGTLTLMTARLLLKRGHEVVIIERDKSVAEELPQQLDCGILQGDGSKPAILREADPGNTDLLFCVTGSDQANIIAALVGRSLGFERVVAKIDDPEFEHICLELGLEDTIIPARTIGRHLADMCEGRDPLELSTMIRDEARVLSFVVRESQQGPVSDLNLPTHSRVVCIYRNGNFILPDEDLQLKSDDEVVMITDRDSVEALTEFMRQPD
ncbi:MAG: TrkA family potassium uptake protein [Gammaproteobacteria bacterium]|jgi:trk system potassium uptake protein TrkA